MLKATVEGWDTWRLEILVLITLFWMHKITGEVWDSGTCNFGPKYAILHAKSTDESCDP